MCIVFSIWFSVPFVASNLAKWDWCWYILINIQFGAHLVLYLQVIVCSYLHNSSCKAFGNEVNFVIRPSDTIQKHVLIVFLSWPTTFFYNSCPVSWWPLYIFSYSPRIGFTSSCLQLALESMSDTSGPYMDTPTQAQSFTSLLYLTI